MNALVAALRRAAIFACDCERFPFHKFLKERGLEQILLDADAENWGDTVIATHVLVDCCVTDGKYNNFNVGLLAVIRFLSEQHGDPHLGHVQAFRDLLTILNDGGEQHKVQKWMETHFG